MNDVLASHRKTREASLRGHIRDLFSAKRMAQIGLTPRKPQTLAAEHYAVAMDLDQPAPHTNGESARHFPAVGMIEAGTGTGKTLAYLVAAVDYIKRTGERVVISTYTRALQRQILSGNDLEHAIRLVGADGVTVAPRMGMANFVCAPAVFRYGARLREEMHGNEPFDLRDWIRFERWVESWSGRADADPMDTTFAAWRDSHDGEMPSVKGSPIPESEFACSSDGDPGDLHWFLAHAELARQADIIVTNHASVLMDARLRSMDRKDEGHDLFGAFRVLILDEAERIIDASRSMLQHRLRFAAIAAKVNRSAGKARVSHRQMEAALTFDRVIAEIGALIGWIDITPERLAGELPDAYDLMVRAARAMVDTGLAKVLCKHDVNAAPGVITVLSALLGDGCLAQVLTPKAVRVRSEKEAPEIQDSVYLSFSPVRRLPSVAVDPIDATWMTGLLFSANPEVRPLLARTIVLTSASLSNLAAREPEDDEDVRRIASTLPSYGMWRVKGRALVGLIRSVTPSRNYGRMSFVLPDPRVQRALIQVPGPYGIRMERSDEWVQYLNAAIATIYADEGRRALVLTPSYDDIEALLRLRGVDLDSISGSLVVDGVLFHMRGESASTIKSRVECDGSIRVVVSAGMWEGVNLVLRHQGGERAWMSDLVIGRLPGTPMPTDLVERRVRHLMRHGYDDEAAARGMVYLEASGSALRRLLQGIGRAIRGPNDDVRVWLLDPSMRMASDFSSGKDGEFQASDIAQAIADRAIRSGSGLRRRDFVELESVLPLVHSRSFVKNHWFRAVPVRFRHRFRDARYFVRGARGPEVV